MTEAVQQRRNRTNGERPSGQETGPTPRRSLARVPVRLPRPAYERNSRRFLIGLGVSSLGDAMSTVNGRLACGVHRRGEPGEGPGLLELLLSCQKEFKVLAA